MKELPQISQESKKAGIVSYFKNKLFPAVRKKKYELSPRRNAACIFVMDLSESMNFPKNRPNIDRMNNALKQFRSSIMRQYEGSGIHLEIALVSFSENEAKILNDFTPIENWEPLIMSARGLTPMGQGIEVSIKLAQDYRRRCREESIELQKLWMILFTDGCPTDSIRVAASQLRQQDDKKEKDYDFWIIASESADLRICHKLTKHVMKMKDGEYESAFHSVENLMLECKD